jgi:hypothetical protein
VTATKLTKSLRELGYRTSDGLEVTPSYISASELHYEDERLAA